MILKLTSHLISFIHSIIHSFNRSFNRFNCFNRFKRCNRFEYFSVLFFSIFFRYIFHSLWISFCAYESREYVSVFFFYFSSFLFSFTAALKSSKDESKIGTRFFFSFHTFWQDESLCFSWM